MRSIRFSIGGRYRLWLLWLCLPLLSVPAVFAQTYQGQATSNGNTESASQPSPRFFLLTIGPGPEYWSAWGHTALLVSQPGQDDLIYGYGYFNFSDEDFFSNFIKGRMRYYLASEQAARELGRYAAEGRDIWVQALNLPDDKARALLAKLKRQDTDANRYYDYDYFLANCTSQVRDLINQALDKSVAPILSAQPGPSWAEATLPVANQGWLNLALHLGYGHSVWQPRNRWQAAVFPLMLKDSLESLAQQPQPPAQPAQQLYQGRPVVPRFFATHGPLVFITVGFLLAILWPRSRWLAIRVWLGVQSLVGFLLLALWLLTEHRVVAQNPNILLMWPLALLAVSKKYRRIGLLFYGLASVLWLVWAIQVGAWYLAPLLVLNGLCVFFLFRDLWRTGSRWHFATWGGVIAKRLFGPHG